MQTFERVLWLMGAVLLAAPLVFASGEGKHQAEPAQEKGPHGGRLLRKNSVSVELAIYEQGFPPQYRAWITDKGRPVSGGPVDLKVELTRLGGNVDKFSFSFQDGYWLGAGVVEEPHSFDVKLTLRMGGQLNEWEWESHEGRTAIDPKLAQRAGIRAAVAGPGTIRRTLTTYGRLTAARDQVAQVRARFPGLVTQVHADLGDRVRPGDVLAEVESNESLKTYAVRAPLAGKITARQVSVGELTGDQPIFAIANHDSLWAELKIFPGQRAQVAAGQAVMLTADGLEQSAKLAHLLPDAEGSPYVIARARVDNPSGLLVPGVLVQGEILVEEVAVPLVVDSRALQTFRDWTVVFLQVGDTYEIRPLKLGRSDGRRSEVLAGLRTGDRYVVENSYIIKADIEKSDASHDH